MMRKLVCVAFILVGACGPSSRSDNFGDGDDGSGCAKSCSADLHSVVDCNNNVVQTCDADQGCANGACADACAAAAANQSSVGCDYYSVDPDIIAEVQGACFAAYIANTWGAPISITLERGGQSLDVSQFARVPTGQGQSITYEPLMGGMLMPNQIAILFLAQTAGSFVTCPVTPAITNVDAAVHGTGLGQAFHITTSAPAVAYDIFPYGGGQSAATSATLLLPTSAWDINYIGVDAFAKSSITPGQPFTEIVAQEDGTTVTIRPTATIQPGNMVTGGAMGTNQNYTLNKGQVLQFTQDAELNGSPITADKPIGVWGGASCLNVPVDTGYCDSAHQEIPPVKAMGYRYAAVRYRNRFAGNEESVPWRMVGGVDGTQLTYSPAAPAGAPTTLNLGQIAQFNAPGPFYVTSQDTDHPFYMSAHMTGCASFGNDEDCRGDAEFVNVVPPDQYLSSYTFFTDPTYSETNLVFTREKKNGVFSDVTIDCSGTITNWQPVDSSDTIEFARLDLVTGNFAPVGQCNNGLHVASSTQPFGLVVWGWGSAASSFNTLAVSYAYPAGASVKPINNVVIE
ncbi:MAG: IgGFc-binding protein [Kofleriaceae bacterium]